VKAFKQDVLVGSERGRGNLMVEVVRHRYRDGNRSRDRRGPRRRWMSSDRDWSGQLSSRALVAIRTTTSCAVVPGQSSSVQLARGSTPYQPNRSFFLHRDQSSDRVAEHRVW